MVAGAADISTGSVGSPPMRNVNMTSYKADTTKPIDSTTNTIFRRRKAMATESTEKKW